jgi:hypothetical protein
MSYIGIEPVSAENGFLQRNTFIAGSGQTVFVSSYTPGYVDVYVNGVKLVNGIDFAAIDGNTIVLTNGTSANDNVEVFGIQTTAVNTLRNKNLLINGNFDIWQRGISLASSTGPRYLADRWAGDSLNTTYTISQQSFTLGQTLVPNNPSYFNRMVVSSVAGASNYCVINQRIERVNLLSGKTVTLSFWAKADAAKSVSIEAYQNFGVGGSPSLPVFGIGTKKLTISTTWVKYTHTFTFPSTNGKTLGTSGDFTNIVFWFDGGSIHNSRTDSIGQQSGTFDIAQVQLEIGNIATEFEILSVEEEYSKCRRYYQKSYDVATSPGTVTASGMNYLYSQFSSATATHLGTNVSFKTPMRGNPTVISYSPSTGASGKARDYTAAVDVTPSISSSCPGGFYWTAALNAATIAPQIGLNWTADAEL